MSLQSKMLGTGSGNFHGKTEKNVDWDVKY